MPEPRVLVSLPLYGGVCYDRFLSSWTDLLQWSNQAGVHFSLQIITNESLLPRARNLGVVKLLDNADTFTHMLFVDGDMGFRPYRFERLLQWNKPMVGCPGPVKFIYWDNVYDAIREGKDPQTFGCRYAVNFLDAGGFQAESGFTKVQDMGCCFFLVQTQALVEMAQSYQNLRCHAMSHVNGQPVNSQNQFTFFDTARDSQGRYLECDHAFMFRWRQLGEGHDIWADMTGDLDHVGVYHFKGSMSQYFFGEEMATAIESITTPYGTQLPEADDTTAAATSEAVNG
jgi:hypothetical protein